MAKRESKKLTKPRPSAVTRSQFLVIILITVALAIVLDFGHRVTVSAELQREAQRLEREVTTLEAENHVLVDQQDRVQTDDYVEEWARTEGGMVLYGETPVVPLPARQTTPTGKATPNPTLSDDTPSTEEISSHWPEWWALFFGPDESQR